MSKPLCSFFGVLPEMKDYFNTFWWKVFEKNFGINASTANDLEKLRLHMIKQDEMKRKILLATYIKFKVWKRTKYDPTTQNTSEELKVVVLGEGGVGELILFDLNWSLVTY